MFSSRSTFALMCALQVASVSAQYQLIREYSGSTFFNNWTYYGTYDNLTHGSVIWVDEKTATSNKLAYVDPVTNNAVLRVDNFTRVANGSLRNSVRINTNELYGVGSVWVGDFVRVPFGCSVWGSFWSTATEAEISPAVWPTGGEIDTFEAYNLVSKNTFTLHTNPGCSIPQNATNPNPLINSTDCDSSTGGLGCTVTANDTRSYGPSFSQAGGGVYVTEFGVNAISMWFFSRDDVPKTLGNNVTSINTNSLGPPSAIYPATSCNIGQLFKPQSLVLDITLCGDLAGAPGLFNQTCSGVCYDDWVIGEPSNFDNAYFEIRAVRVFTMPNTTIVTPTLPRASPSSTGGIPPIPTFALASSAELDIRRVALWSVLLTALTIVATVVTTGL